ncbi:MAG: glycoside hydrolase family 5 protein [Nanoarchaeota archaeon]|nr:glycoside hydrolase family 5 protein [Nanoarchaeota archaeon]MBU1320907.1 glycoside hydrolase family 5 protein [Nanoarchaeota archaeon]MBU1597568.1 glycoside hydrolase family 5 protein [Nanoarchaeota archaeon]MBU2442265.1 glycoside hydrolase family 5 protein [Nanoarchaeota archaeon]
MEKILVDKSRLYVKSGIITLNGVSLPDYYWLIEKEKQKIEIVIRTIKELGFNTIRVPVLPGHFLFYNNYLNKTIKNIVDLSAKYKLYCILDWHAIGNPLHNQTRLKEYFHIKNNKPILWYSANLEIASSGLDILSKLFGKYKHVIFEIYNEPCPAEKDILQLDLSALPWKEWRKIAGDLISIVRKNTKNLILVSSNYWSFNLKSTSEDPFNEYSNIAYSFHCYPFKNNKNWKEMLDSMKEFPVVVTEFGYDTDKKSQYNSSYDDYLKPFMDYLRRNRISWIGWCFSSSWRSRIVLKWQPLELSDFGKHIIKNLIRNN